MDFKKILLSASEDLMTSLGPSVPLYKTLMRSWFRLQISREQLEIEIKKFMTPEQYLAHNKMFKNLLWKCIFANKTNFEPTDPIYYNVTEIEPVSPKPPCITSEGHLPDLDTTVARLTHGALGIGLEGCTTPAAEMLMLALQQFLKNIFTAILAQKKGFKCKSNGFIHGLNTPYANPWLKNAEELEESFHGISIDKSGFLFPTPRPTKDENDYINASLDATHETDYNKVDSISLYDLFTTLRLYPSLISSHFVLSVNMERIISRLHHPSWDD